MSAADSSAGRLVEKNREDALTDNHAIEKMSATRANFAEQKRLLGYLKALNIPEEQQQLQPNKKFYYHLANVFARLRLYPLAMKCFLKTVPVAVNSFPDTIALDTAALTVSYMDDTTIARQVASGQVSAHQSKATSYSKLLANFNDGKPAAGYALVFHVKQPVPGKRKIFVWGNTGHTFITLIKYNKDSSYVSASFGFYPKKDQLLSATPVFPTTSSTFKDDAGHQWDEVIGKFISKHKFERILKLTKDFDGVKYDLNNRNCTDFGLQAAGLAGINITDTAGKWPLGKGNNPAVTGQSILMGKVSNADPQTGDELFKANLVKQ
ncbi:MAG: hypothetical protein V4592_17695 [Bacteroidota bacterium]